MRSAGMILPGNCTPVTGSMIGVVMLDKLPVRHSAGARVRKAVPPVSLTYTLIVGEEENPILDYRPTKCAAEDILPEVVLLRVVAVVRPGVRIERVIANELERVPVQIVGPGLQRGVHGGAGHIAEFRRRIAGLDLELRERVDVRLVADPVIDGLVDGDAVEEEGVSLLAVAVHERTSLSTLEARSGEPAWVRRDASRDQQRELLKIPPFSGRVSVVLPEMTVPTVGFSVCRTGDVPLTVTSSVTGADLELQIDSCRLIHLELDDVRNNLLEPCQFGADHVAADGQKRDPVHARVARFCGVFQFRRLIRPRRP